MVDTIDPPHIAEVRIGRNGDEVLGAKSEISGHSTSSPNNLAAVEGLMRPINMTLFEA